MRKYHHVGIPTEDVRVGEEHLPEYGLHTSGYEDSPYGVEWMRFDPDSPLPELVKNTPHVAFEVDDLDAELTGKEILIEPNSPSPGVRVAFIIENGAPIELMEIDKEKEMTWLEIEPPAAHEYDPYYAGYIDLVDGKQLSLIMRRQRAQVIELLASLSDEQARYRYAPDKWRIKEVMGHLIDTERVFAYRALSIARGEVQSLPGFDQNEYVVTGGFDARSVESLSGEYEAVRNASLALFESLDEASWLKTGMANDVSVSVRAIGYIIPGHEAHHLSILRERYLTQI